MNANQQLNLKDILLKALKSKLSFSDYITLMLYGNWETICGPDLGKKTKPKAFNKDILTVSVDNPVLLFELGFKKEDLLGKVNGYLFSLEKKKIFAEKAEKHITARDIRFINN
ncbi:MAG: DUF721 domain-containing protein [Deltaproteobacteria bacterium]|jgi:hypothetical protein|nr:DUF721 domain-containing protein [Deltaproteobacteria bacterium]MCL5880628.1 DUF721 domain-containing protein [Deltaproteobacteria bacterium]MDA8305139.1 DUF721 domain-containing protein [Deltaproteobacteria bacterium]